MLATVLGLAKLHLIAPNTHFCIIIGGMVSLPRIESRSFQ